MSFKKILYYTSYHGFGVCERWSRFAGISTNKVRVAFLYTFFFTAGAGFAMYFLLALVTWLKDLFVYKRKSVFDL